MVPTLRLLAEGGMAGVIFWSLILFVFILAAFAAVVWVKKQLLAPDDEPGGKVGFSLGDLKQLYKKGQMTQAEYERARAQMIASAKVEQLPEILTPQQKAAAARNQSLYRDL